MNLTSIDFEFVRQVVRERTGNDLGPDKGYLVETRLQPLARAAGCDSLLEFLRRVRQANDRASLLRIAESLLITETYFHREPKALEELTTAILPPLLSRRRASGKGIRVWSAACSSGQEVYTLAMLVAETTGHLAAGNTGHVRIVGSDLSSAMLDRARRGEYSAAELDRGLPPRFRRWFTESAESTWRIADSLRACVEFQPVNLLTDSLPGPWDVILVRNVLIYFDEPRRDAIFRRLHSQLAPDGWLIVGGTETTTPPAHLFQRASPFTACFQRARQEPS